MPRQSVSDDDPITRLAAPPPDETEDQRAARLLAEREAKARSDAIDAEINRQRAAEKKEQKPIKVSSAMFAHSVNTHSFVKVLLLGMFHD